jgi:hypothetical protein
MESLKLNVERLKEYKARLVLFPRHANKLKKGDSSGDDITNARQLKGPIVSKPVKESVLTFTKITDVSRRHESDAFSIGLTLSCTLGSDIIQRVC